MNVNPTYTEVRYPNGREAAVSTRHLSPCPKGNNEVVDFCNKTLESDVTENDSNVAVDSGKNINEIQCERRILKKIILLLLNKMRDGQIVAINTYYLQDMALIIEQFLCKGE